MMTSLDTESAVDRPEGPSVRDAVEAAYASHSPSPDLTSIVSGAVEHDRATAIAIAQNQLIITSTPATARLNCARLFAVPSITPS